MNKQEIMRRAWEIKRQDSRYVFGLCLKMAWAEARKPKESLEGMIASLESLGFKRWTMGDMDRMYIDARRLGLEVIYYNTGNVRAASFEGGRISNCEARRLLGAKTYVDLADGKVRSTHDWLLEAACKLTGRQAA